MKNKSKDPKHKTTVESRTLNPYWDQEFVFDNITFSDLSSKVLQVSVHDASAGSKKNFLGAVRLGLGTSEQAFDDSNDKECVTWQKMLQEPNKRISATLSLRSTIESLKRFGDFFNVLLIVSLCRHTQCKREAKIAPFHIVFIYISEFA